jgi:hypothetical protein
MQIGHPLESVLGLLISMYTEGRCDILGLQAAMHLETRSTLLINSALMLVGPWCRLTRSLVSPIHYSPIALNWLQGLMSNKSPLCQWVELLCICFMLVYFLFPFSFIHVYVSPVYYVHLIILLDIWVICFSAASSAWLFRNPLIDLHY